jgi:CheY-like chemotaxis protein
LNKAFDPGVDDHANAGDRLFCATLMPSQRGVTIPTLALTANAMIGFEQQILKSAKTAYLTKPLDIDLLLHTG